MPPNRDRSLRAEVWDIHLTAVLEQFMRAARLAYGQGILLAAGTLAAYLSPLADLWYFGGPLSMLVGFRVVDWLRSGQLRGIFASGLPNPPTKDEDYGAALERLRHFLDEDSRPINRSDLRDTRFWVAVALFLMTQAGVGAYTAALLGSFTYGLGVVWIYTILTLGLGYLQSRLVANAVRRIVFAGLPGDQHRPE